MRYFITATDTGAGKTYVSCLLLRALRAAGRRATGFKPLCCGSREDVAALLECSDAGATAELVNPVYYKMPLAPLAAGMLENRGFALEEVLGAWRELAERYEHIIVEGCGGWEVPLTDRLTMADVAAALGLPVLVVVNNRLGALNHTILTVRAVQARGLRCAGLILNYAAASRDAASISNAAVLRAVLPELPVVAEVMHGETEMETDGLE